MCCLFLLISGQSLLQLLFTSDMQLLLCCFCGWSRHMTSMSLRHFSPSTYSSAWWLSCTGSLRCLCPGPFGWVWLEYTIFIYWAWFPLMKGWAHMWQVLWWKQLSDKLQSSMFLYSQGVRWYIFFWFVMLTA